MMPTVDTLRECLQDIETLLDRAIARAGREYADELLQRPNGVYDLKRTTDESYGLSQGKDLCYDRPSIGLTYGLWYHPRRVNTCLRQVLPNLVEARPTALRVCDLGAGSGAFLWAFALAAYAIRECGGTPLSIHVVNVDNSPIMLDYLARAWQHLTHELPEVEQDVTQERAVNSWTRTDATGEESWLCASYLFDHSDKKKDLSREFTELVAAHQPSRILLSTSNRKGAEYFGEISKHMADHDFSSTNHLCTPIFAGRAEEINSLRSELKRHYHRITDQASWDEKWHEATTFVQTAPTLGVEAPDEERFQIFRPKTPERRDVVLTPEQERAAELSDRPTIVWGSAGSGKSIVLSERIRILAEKHDYSQHLRILVTTFNKELVQQLKQWIYQILDEERFKSEGPRSTGATYAYFFKNSAGAQSPTPNISLMHFDLLPTRIGMVHKEEERFNIAGQGNGYEEAVRALIGDAIEEVRGRLSEFDVDISRVKRILDIEFIHDELHRVVYGQRAYTREKFLKADRPGRPVVQRSGRPRELLWEVLNTFSRLTKETKVRTFLQRRIHFLNKIEIGDISVPFTHLFVDEIQDCTPADFQIFRSLVSEPNNIFITGDLAQAVHIGRSASTRLSSMYPEFKRIRPRRLEGSFRLPFRVSEALIPLSGRIQRKRKPCNDSVDVTLSHPYKGSPPGVRPILVAASDTDTMAEKIISIGTAYGSELGDVGFATANGPLILESDIRLRNAIRERGGKAHSDTILRVKGLEHPWIVWSTRAAMPSEDDAEEFAYTIMTRGSGLVVIALFSHPPAAYQAVLNTFERDRIICWDEASSVAFANAQQDRPFDDDVEPHSASPLDEESRS